MISVFAVIRNIFVNKDSLMLQKALDLKSNDKLIKSTLYNSI